MATLIHGGGLSDRTLKRLVTWGAIALALLMVAFGVVYYLGQHTNTGPDLATRQVDAAEQAVRDKPQDLGARLTLASVYRAVGRTDDALTQYDEVIKADKGNEQALLGRGETRLVANDLDGAAADLAKMISLASGAEFANVNQTLNEAHYYLAKVRVAQNQLDGALKELTAALGIEPTDSDSLYLLGTVQLKQHQADAAAGSFQQALTFVPTGWCEPYQGLADAYTQSGKAAQAEYAGAMVDACEGRTDQAKSRLGAITSGPSHADALVGLGLIAETAGDKTAAAKQYQAALAVDKRNIPAMTGLSRLGVSPTGTSGAS